ncbi:MAG: hypothetical protein IJ003_00925 [Candidatus Gastranaerophilales bacterium]|nr:hypothetical protein [Candidatus Gastranaerophilales bacterium]
MESITTKDKTPLGANYIEETKSVEFRVYSKNATMIKLCIFDSIQGENPVMVLDMKKEENDIWSTTVKDYILNCKKRPVFYGYRVFGPNWEYDDKFEPGSSVGFKSKFDDKNNRFNPNKIAYDPYSKELSHLPSDVNPGFNMFRSGANFHLIDNSKWAIKSVFSPKKDENIAQISPRPFNSEIIGEVHIKDLTQNINIPEKGTYKGAMRFAKNIKNLGITMVEFLPLNEFDSKQNGTNHWGYMPLGYFTLARKYAYDKSFGNLLYEFRQMIDEFHKNDIKVCLDMVYNHTGEGGLVNHNVDDANLFSYALIDNSSYYKVYKNGYYRSNSGCGNDFNISNDGALNLIVDSLEFWVNQGVDAFRFDLAAALLEHNVECEEIYDHINSLAARLKEKLEEKNISVVDDFSKAQKGIVLIAEPWTCGGKDCYQLGNFPSYWAEWNDISRDTIRKITLRPNEVTPNNMKDIIEGTYSRFNGKNKSINYIAAHDGFTLYDLNNFRQKSSSTQGGSTWEICGDYDNNAYKQENAIRKQLVFLFASYGTPMIQIGDIIMHTKNGNNNSYNKDDGTNYLNWDKAVKKDTFENRTMEYIRNLIKFRNENSIFRSNEFIKSLTYHYDNGQIADYYNSGYWNNPLDLFFGVLINSSQNRIYIASSKGDNNMTITLPENLIGKTWFKCIDTSDFSNISFDTKEQIEERYVLNPQALAIFMEK